MGRAVRRLANTANVLHGFIYFVPEAAEEYEKLGLDGFRPQYFGSRAAPMGPVGSEVVMATFFNFSPEAVADGIPYAWGVASPEELQAARFAAAKRVLDRVGGVLQPSDVAEASEIVSASACVAAAGSTPTVRSPRRAPPSGSRSRRRPTTRAKRCWTSSARNRLIGFVTWSNPYVTR